MSSMNWVVVHGLSFICPVTKKAYLGFILDHRHWTRPRLYLKPVCMDCKRYQSSGGAKTNWIIWVQRARSKKSCLALSRDQNLKDWHRKRNQEDKPIQNNQPYLTNESVKYMSSQVASRCQKQQKGFLVVVPYNHMRFIISPGNP